jgi:hypothetical protein
VGLAGGVSVAVGPGGVVSAGKGVLVGVEVAVEVGVAVNVATRVLVGVGEAAGAPAISEPSEHPSAPNVRTGMSKMIGAILRLMI